MASPYDWYSGSAAGGVPLVEGEGVLPLQETPPPPEWEQFDQPAGDVQVWPPPEWLGDAAPDQPPERGFFGPPGPEPEPAMLPVQPTPRPLAAPGPAPAAPIQQGTPAIGPVPGAAPGGSPLPEAAQFEWAPSWGDAPEQGSGDEPLPFSAAPDDLQGDPFAPEPEAAPAPNADQQASDLLRSGQEGIAANRVNLEQDRANFLANEKAKALESDAKQSAQNLLTWQKAADTARREGAELRAESKRLAENPPSRASVWANKSMVSKIGSFVAAIAGGLNSPYNGGKNSGLDLILAEMDKDVEVQQQNLAARRQGLAQELDAVGDSYQRSGDEFRAVESVRLANLGKLDQMLAAEGAKFDPNGTRAQLLAEARSGVRQKQAEAIASVEEKLHKRAMEGAELQIRQETLAEQRRARGAAQAQARQQAAEAQKRWAFEKGAVLGPDGNWIADPNRAASGDPQDELARLRGEKVSQELQHGEEERVVQGVGGKPLGRARSTQAGENMRQRIATYDRYQTEITELANMLTNPDGTAKSFYQGPGWELTKNPERDKIRAKALNVLYLQAKINDPSTGVRDAEIEFGKNIVPFVQGLTSGKSPAAQADAIRAQADTDLRSHMDAEIIGGAAAVPPESDPIRSWQATRAAIEQARSAPVKAQSDSQSLDVLVAPIAQGTPKEARSAFIEAKKGVIERWVRDSPWVVEGLNPEGIKAHWQDDPSLTPAERLELGAALDDAAGHAQASRLANPAAAAFRQRVSGSRKPAPPEEGEE